MNITHGLRRALQIDPRRKEARINLAESLLESGRLGEALQEAADARRLAPDVAEAHAVLGNALLAAGDPAAAAASYAEALRRNPGLVSARRGLEEAGRRAAVAAGAGAPR